MKFILAASIGLLAFSSMSQNAFTAEDLWKLNRISGGQLSPDKKDILYTSTNYKMADNKGNTDIFIYNLANKKKIALTDTPFSEFEVKWMKDGSIVYLSAESGSVQLWKMNPNTRVKEQISFLKNDIEGYTLSDQNNRIITLQSVKTKMTVRDLHPDLPLANARIENDLMYRHWNQWDDEFSTQLFLHTFDEKGILKEGRNLMEGEKFDGVVPPFGGSENVIFSPNGEKVYYSSKKMLGKEFAQSTNSDLFVYDTKYQSTSNFTEGMMGYDNSPAYSPDGMKMAWLSMGKNGFESDKNVLFIFDFKTLKKTTVSLTIDLTVSDFKWELDGKQILFTAPHRGVQQLFSHHLSKNTTTQLTTERMNVVSYDLSDEHIILGLQSMIAPTDLYLLNRKTKKLENITNANRIEMSKISLPKVEERWIKTSDGKEMLTWVVLPPNFDENKKYPTLLYCQGGPQSMVSQFFSYRWNLMLMASEGYIVVAPNRRGLPGFGQEWNDAISKDWGGQPIRDYLSAIDEMAKEPYVDETKLGAVGASYGGYSVYYLAGMHNNRFKTFISHCGLFNLESWYGTTEELFFANWDIGGPYWETENKVLFEKNSPHKMVKNWNTPILVIHGGIDFRVPESEGMQAFQAAQLMGIKSKYLLFPTEGHWVQKPQNGLLWQREFFKWLAEDLK